MANTQLTTDRVILNILYLEFIFLGHNGWLIKTENQSIYIDPIIVDGNGAGPDGGRVFPPRSINLKKLPPAKYIFFSHEHTDHFHVPSLKWFNKDATILVGNLMPNFILDLLNTLGFHNIKIVTPSIPFEIGNLSITFYNAAFKTAFWEQRVSQFLFVNNLNSCQSIYFSVDADLSQHYINDIKRSKVMPPSVIAISNNLELASDGSLGTLDDSRVIKSNKARSFLHLKLLSELFVNYVSQIPKVENILIVGGGYVKDDYKFSNADIYIQKDISRIANLLSKSNIGISPFPGTLFKISNKGIEHAQLDYVEIHEGYIDSIPSIGFKAYLFKSVEEEAIAIECFREYLPTLSRSILLSTQGKILATLREFNGKLIGPHRLVLQIDLDFGLHPLFFVLNIQTAKFEEVNIAANDLSQEYPFGLIMKLWAWHNVLNGNLQIWDVSKTMYSWYEGDNPFNSLIAFLYIHLGEQVRPDLALKAIAKTI